MSDFDEILKGLRSLYLEETRQRVASMARIVGDLERHPEAAEALSLLAVQFHGLAGTGTSYGFEELSLLGRMGEYDIGIRQRFGGGCSQEECRTWKALISQIEAAASLPLALTACA